VEFSQGAPLPVTARLSKAFYDRFGEQIVNELVEWFNSVDATYKADIRELIDVNNARMDARMNQFAAELRGEMKAMKSELLAWMFAFWVTTTVTLAGLILTR